MNNKALSLFDKEYSSVTFQWTIKLCPSATATGELYACQVIQVPILHLYVWQVIQVLMLCLYVWQVYTGTSAALVCLTDNTGVEERAAHAMFHPEMGEPQGFRWGTLTKKLNRAEQATKTKLTGSLKQIIWNAVQRDFLRLHLQLSQRNKVFFNKL